MEELLGKTINKIEISDDGLYLKFIDIDGMEYYYYAANDCCNSVWFSTDVYNASAMLNSPILEVEDIQVDLEKFPYPEEEYPDVQDSYGIKIKTIKGITNVVYRNSHNGYYGGDCIYLDSDLVNSGYYHKNLKAKTWTEVTSDYPFVDKFDGELDFEV